jgi:DNA-binding response OmpR family regulator
VHSGRPSVLAIHDDGDTLDLLTRAFEADGFEVATAVSGFRAQAHLEGDRAAIDVVVAPWGGARSLGEDVYRWILQHRYDLRDRFVFLAAEAPPEFDRLVAGRCLAVSPDAPAEVVRVARAAVRRRAQIEAARDQVEIDLDLDRDRPTLLVADADPGLLLVIADLFADAGYAVTRVETVRGAIELLSAGAFDAIVADLRMEEEGGAALLAWIAATRPELAERLVFLAADDRPIGGPGPPVFRKGADSGALLEALREIVRRARGGSGGPGIAV